MMNFRSLAASAATQCHNTGRATRANSSRQLPHRSKARCRVLKAVPDSGPGNGMESSSKSSSRLSGAAAAFKAGMYSTIYNREPELGLLKGLCSEEPTSISLVLGNRSCGKTAIIRKFLSSGGLEDSRCYVDARAGDITSPDLLAEQLQQSALPSVLLPFVSIADKLPTALPEVLKKFIETVQEKVRTSDTSEITVSGKTFVSILEGLGLTGSTSASPLKRVIDAYNKLLGYWKQAQASGALLDSWPVLVIDEADELMTWEQEHKTQQRQLLRFLTRITKQDNSAHVLLVTSEYAFQSWLSKEIGAGFYQVYVIGDLTPEHARGFLNECLQKRKLASVSDADWEDVFQVCGGNPGDLRRAAVQYSLLGPTRTWTKALNLVSKEVWGSMQPAFSPPPESAYTAVDAAIAVKAILDSPYKAVEIGQLETLLGGQTPLEAMVQANLLVLRPYSDWASDIEPEAFGQQLNSTIITAPTAMHLYHMECNRSWILAPLATVEVEVEAGHDVNSSNRLVSPSSSRSASPTSSRLASPTGSRSASPISSRSGSPTSAEVREINDEIAAVNSEIGDVKKKLQHLDVATAELLGKKGEGWQAEVQVQESLKQRLVETLRQLHQDLVQLRDERYLLRKRESAEL